MQPLGIITCWLKIFSWIFPRKTTKVWVKNLLQMYSALSQEIFAIHDWSLANRGNIRISLFCPPISIQEQNTWTSQENHISSWVSWHFSSLNTDFSKEQAGISAFKLALWKQPLPWVPGLTYYVNPFWWVWLTCYSGQDEFELLIHLLHSCLNDSTLAAPAQMMKIFFYKENN